MWPAPLVLALSLAALLGAVLALTVDAAAADVAGAVVPELVVAAAVEAAPDGLVEPLISAWIVELKVPVIPVRLFKTLRRKFKYQGDTTHVNLAENASALALIWAWLGSFRLTDVILIKLARRIGHLFGKKVIQHSLGVEVGSNRGIRCPLYRGNLRNIDVADQLQ
jgi:hypothetical protein